MVSVVSCLKAPTPADSLKLLLQAHGPNLALCPLPPQGASAAYTHGFPIWHFFIREPRRPTPVLFLIPFHAFSPPGIPVQSGFIIIPLHKKLGWERKGVLLRVNTGGVRKVHRNSVGKHSEVLASDVEVNVPSLGSFLESQDIQAERGLEE